MSRPSTRLRERRYFELLRTHYPVPTGETEYGDKPDVIVRGPTAVGVEISNLYLMPGTNPASEQVQRKRRLQVLAEAQRLYEAAGGKHLELSVDFQPSCPIESVTETARSLANLAEAAAAHPAGVLPTSVMEQCPQARLVYNNPVEYPDAQWRTVQYYTVPSLSPASVREVVASKSHKVAGYAPCDTYWLLLVVDFLDRAQDQELQWPAGTGALVSSYERVLVFKPQFGLVGTEPDELHRIR
jgi:hypothetical protein